MIYGQLLQIYSSYSSYKKYIVQVPVFLTFTKFKTTNVHFLKLKLEFMQSIHKWISFTYSLSLLCIDGTRLCVNRLRDLQGFELYVGGTCMSYH